MLQGSIFLMEHINNIKAKCRSSGHWVKRLASLFSILQDLSGPKMRVGDLPEMGVELNDGKAIHFTTSQLLSNFSNQKVTFIPLDVPSLFESLKPGNHILLDDGKWT